ncbi:uncharacterized protein LOC106438920 [Brassica napus]|uniref:uncharacterized protein LOC106438920 n=1 Tax=Brassica napus TaxID=3708 RepID=UPI002078EB7B|nr:uncharacterized protein LOC106438920 [Brassica napus]XP_048632154.1 uncharacterized protein LOC106438920 [Brassica napus]
MVLHVMLGELVSLNMSNGVGEGGRSQSRESHGKRRELFQSNDFAYALARMAVAQICENVEVNVSQKGVRFSSFQESALDTLTCVAVQYIQSIGKSAQVYANVAGRVEGNSLDIVQALEDLGSGSGVSDGECCLGDFGIVKDVIRYTGEEEEVPFVYDLPRFPINKEKRGAPSFSEVGAEPPYEHIPVWLPAFPETNVGTIEGNGPSLPSIQHSFNGGGLEVLKSPKSARNSTQGEEEMEGNPFLAAPLRFVENEVSPVVRLLELSNEVVGINHVSDKHTSNNNSHIPVLETSTPCDDINNKNKLSESEDGKKKGGARPQQTLLCFKIGTLKRPSCLAIKGSVQGRRWFQEGEVKREKKSETEENGERFDLANLGPDVVI